MLSKLQYSWVLTWTRSWVGGHSGCFRLKHGVNMAVSRQIGLPSLLFTVAFLWSSVLLLREPPELFRFFFLFAGAREVNGWNLCIYWLYLCSQFRSGLNINRFRQFDSIIDFACWSPTNKSADIWTDNSALQFDQCNRLSVTHSVYCWCLGPSSLNQRDPYQGCLSLNLIWFRWVMYERKRDEG